MSTERASSLQEERHCASPFQKRIPDPIPDLITDNAHSLTPQPSPYTGAATQNLAITRFEVKSREILLSPGISARKKPGRQSAGRKKTGKLNEPESNGSRVLGSYRLVVHPPC
jgi:hypothetical protein